ncbi:hypothetical protein J2Z42_000396 [Clostridium algifaecis]|uniref:Uncharacterized protein n=1 Tax=Clostridium algifaecis TaxID=1472040 RepID=A0ABS4KQS0_9CLOT|nr:hypothetical protein [Clostridium algifaecis]
MIAFKKMWDDVCYTLSNNKIDDIDIIENFNNGFIIKDESNTHFVTKQDFVDFWCNIVCLDKVDKEDILKSKNSGKKYVYEILKTLPYIKENGGILKLSE